MPRAKIELSEEELSKITTMAGLGLTVVQMAAILGMSKATFDRRMSDTEGASEALEKGRATAAQNVMATAYKMAISGNVPAMTMFWLKCRQRWKETNVHEVSGVDGGPIDTRNTSEMSDEQILARIEELRKKREANVGT